MKNKPLYRKEIHSEFDLMEAKKKAKDRAKEEVCIPFNKIIGGTEHQARNDTKRLGWWHRRRINNSGII